LKYGGEWLQRIAIWRGYNGLKYGVVYKGLQYGGEGGYKGLQYGGVTKDCNMVKEL
jgi:hypothetical protein